MTIENPDFRIRFREDRGGEYTLRPIVVDTRFVREFCGVDDWGYDPGGSLLEQCRDDIRVFTRVLLGLDITSWQAFVLRRLQLAVEKRVDLREVGVLASRQVGKTDGVIVPFNIWVALFNKLPISSVGCSKCMVFSAGQDQGKDLIDRIVERFKVADAKLFSRDADRFGRNFFMDLLEEGSTLSKTRIRFPAADSSRFGDVLFGGSLVGSEIVTRTPSSSSYGLTASTVTIDEAALVSESFIEDVAGPFTNKADGVLLMTSTPQPNTGEFFNRCDAAEEGDNGYYCFDIRCIELERKEFFDVVNAKIERKLEMGKDDSVDRKYYCKWTTGTGVYLDKTRVQEVFEVGKRRGLTQRSLQELAQDGGVEFVDVGVDFGGTTSSHSVLTVSRFDEESGVIERLWHKRYPINGDNDLVDDVMRVMRVLPVQRVIVDDCGQGWDKTKTMKDKGLPVTKMNFSSKKASKFSAFKRYLYEGRIASYPDELFKEEMNGLREKELRRTTRIEPSGDGTDDLVDSFVISSYYFLNEDNRGTEVIDIFE